MKKELTYSDTYKKLKELVEQLEDGKIPLDKLTLKVKQANELIEVCEIKLRAIDNEIKESIKASLKAKKKKSR